MNFALATVGLFALLLARFANFQEIEYCGSSEHTAHGYENRCHLSNDTETCPRNDTVLASCCICHDLCCPSFDSGREIDNDTVFYPQFKVLSVKLEAKSNQSLIPAASSSVANLTRAVSGTVTGVLGAVPDRVVVRVRRAEVSKTARGTGEDAEEVIEEKVQNNGTSRTELEEAIANAVRIALNKLATLLKNVTESEEPGPIMNATSTTVAPPVESCSSKSKRCEEQEPDLLDEFFPRNPAKGRPRGRKRRDHANLPEYTFKTLEIKKGQDFGSSGGLIAKGEIPDTRNKAKSKSKSKVTTTETPETTTEEATTTGNFTHGNSNGTRSSGKANWRQWLEEHNMTDDVEETSSTRPSLVTSSLLVPKIKPGKCENLTASNKTCIAIQPDAAQCTVDADCEGTRKCCFYGCKPYHKIGICSVPVFY